MSRLAAGLALAASVLFLPALSSPARADCQPAAADNVTINCTTAGGTQTTTVGTGAQDNVTVTVQPGAAVNVSGANAIFLNDGNTVTNAGTITVDSDSAISVNNNNTVTNNGTIIATGGAFGISAFNGNTIINYGTISADAAGIVIGNGTVINTGSITGTADGALGIGVAPGGTAAITNSGSVVSDGQFSTGILVFGGGGTSTVNNSGLIQANGDTGTALDVGGTAVVTNSGTIVANGPSGVAVLICSCGTVTLTNSGLIQANGDNTGSGGNNAAGIFVSSGATANIVNTGTIEANGLFGAGVQTESGAILNLNNSGLIQANGDSGAALDLGGTATVFNSGTIQANGPSGVAVFICNCGNVTLVNSGTIRANGDNSGSGGNSGIGIWVSNGATANIVNTGTIQATDPLGTGIQADSGAILTVNNSGTITAGSFGINAADGAVIFNSGAISISQPSTLFVLNAVIKVGDNAVLPLTPNIVNTGTLTAGDDASGIFAGANNFILNTGSIVTGNSTGTVLQSGITAGAGSTVINGGSIKVGDGSGLGPSPTMSGMLASGDGDTLQNTGLITTGINAAGIATLGNNTQITNSGIISANGSTGVFVINPGAATTGTVITNNGVITANTIGGTGGIGVNFNDNSGTLTNFGLIQSLGTGSVAINSCAPSCGGTVTIINNGTIDGLVALAVGASITNNGLMTLTATDAAMTVGQVHVTGDAFVQTSGGTLALRVTSNARNDKLATNGSGTLTLDGAIKALVQPGLYANSTIYSNVVTSGGSTTTTTFSRFLSSSPFFTVTPIYDSTDPTSWSALNLQLDRIGFGSVPGLTKNQTAVGNNLEGGYSTSLTGNAATFYGNILAATSVNVLDNLSGEGISGAQNAAFTAGGLFNNTMQTQGLFAPDLGGLSVVIPPPQYAATRIAPGHEAFASLNLNKAPAPAQQPGSVRIWTAAFGATQSLHGQADPGSSTQSVRSGGGVLGADWQTAWDLRVGVAVGGSESTFSVANLATSGRMTGGHIGAYAMKSWGAYYAMASLSYARFDNSTTRLIMGLGPTEAATGRFNSDQLSARFEVGWKQAYGGINVTPFVAVEPAVLWQRGFTESGTTLGLTVDSRTATSLPTFVGVQVDGRMLTPQGAVFAPYSRLSWVHEFQPDRRVSATFITVPGASFTIDGARAASDAARLDTGAKLIFHGVHSLFANFSGEWSDRTESYAATGGFRTAW